MLKITAVLICLITVSACEREQEQADGLPAGTFPVKIITDCGHAIYPAVFNLPQLSGAFPNKELFLGQPVFSFYELLNQEAQSQIILGMKDVYSESEPAARKNIEHRLEQWCRFYHTAETVFSTLSAEEIIAELYQSPEHTILFKPYSERAMFKQKNIEPIDRAATLSSAESSSLISSWITNAAMMDAEDFQRELNYALDFTHN